MSTPEAQLDTEARERDAVDPLREVRSRFSLPPDVIYLDGNSLGALPTHVPGAVQEIVARQWGQDLIASWNDHGWWQAQTRAGDAVGALIGAAPGQTVVGDSTSVNLFKTTAGALRMRPGRRSVVIDPDSFPTDLYVLQGLAQVMDLTVVHSSPGDLTNTLARVGDEVAVVSFSQVDYRTGELFDVAGLTEVTHRHGALALWDLCHSAGAVDVTLDADGVDLAVGCGYKYLSGGPGAPAFTYVARRHQDAFVHPLTGWHGHAEPFSMGPDFAPATGIDRARVGTPPLLSLLAAEAALGVFDGVSMAQVRERSVALTSFFIECLDRLLPDLVLATPRDPRRRGSQVSVRHPQAYGLVQALIARGVIGDFRAPDIARFGVAPLYVGHREIASAVVQLAAVLHRGEHLDPGWSNRTTVT